MKNSILKDILTAISDSKPKTSGYDTTAEVVRIEEGIAWIHIPGGVDETPARLTIDAHPGELVQVRVSGGSAFLVGNASAPPTDDTTAIYARTTAQNANIKAVSAEKTAEGAQVTASDAKETADSILIYDHGYTVAGGVAYFTAYLYQGGKDIKESFDPSQFTWYRKTEDGTEYLGSGYTVSVELDSCGYGAEIIGHFTTTDDSEALTNDGDTLTTDDDSTITVRASGDSVRVRDLAASTVLYDTEKIMVVGTEDEHLITLETLYGYLHDRLESEVIYCGSATELVG